MTSGDWALAASIGQVVAAFFAIPSAVFVGFQVRAARRSSDLTSLLAFHKDFADQERRLFAAEPSDKNQAFVELLNLLEAYAAAHGGSLLNKFTKAQVYERIRDAIAIIELNPDRMNEWSEATSTPMAFSETKKFVSKNRAAIDRSKQQLIAAASSSEPVDRDDASK